MSASLDDGASVQHDDIITAHHSGQSVGDSEDSATLLNSVEAFADLSLCRRVQCAKKRGGNDETTSHIDMTNEGKQTKS